MTTSHCCCVPDTSVLIDSENGGVLDALFALPYRWLLPDLTLAELRRPASLTLFRLGLEVVMFSGQEIAALIRLRATYPALSLPDCAALFLARRPDGLLLTGDHSLSRIAANDFRLEVHGTLWALNRLVALRYLVEDDAARALRAVLKAGGRLPRSECRRRLERWESR